MQDLKTFKKTVWDYYKKHGRTFAWRETRDPYRILVSEIMLQQTQADRVIPKYNTFIKKFPDFKSLADASLSDLLGTWKGLGYNRRALNLKRTAEAVIKDFKGKLPKDREDLLSLPGIGPTTAGDVRAFAWNLPDTVIETNIRSVFIHFFFSESSSPEGERDIRKKIHDKDILPFIEKTVDTKNPREWYYALMDYGTMLKKTVGNASRQSLHHKKQSPFKNSNRKLRADILFLLHDKKRMSEKNIVKHFNDERTLKNLSSLSKEGFISESKSKIGPKSETAWYIVGT